MKIRLAVHPTNREREPAGCPFLHQLGSLPILVPITGMVLHKRPTDRCRHETMLTALLILDQMQTRAR
jgi:hypothetical protein